MIVKELVDYIDKRLGTKIGKYIVKSDAKIANVGVGVLVNSVNMFISASTDVGLGGDCDIDLSKGLLIGTNYELNSYLIDAELASMPVQMILCNCDRKNLYLLDFYNYNFIYHLNDTDYQTIKAVIPTEKYIEATDIQDMAEKFTFNELNTVKKQLGATPRTIDRLTFTVFFNITTEIYSELKMLQDGATDDIDVYCKGRGINREELVLDVDRLDSEAEYIHRCGAFVTDPQVIVPDILDIYQMHNKGYGELWELVCYGEDYYYYVGKTLCALHKFGIVPVVDYPQLMLSITDRIMDYKMRKPKK